MHLNFFIYVNILALHCRLPPSVSHVSHPSLNSHHRSLHSPHIGPVCLPDRFTAFSRQRCFVSGWGKDAFGNRGSFQHLLKEVDLPMVDRRTCQSAFRGTKLGSNFLLHDGMICAGGEEGKDACEVSTNSRKNRDRLEHLSYTTYCYCFTSFQFFSFHCNSHGFRRL